VTAHQVVELVTIAACSCGEQVSASSEQKAEELMAEHIAAARADGVDDKEQAS
jgi:uncharacterized membrane protein YebE (DUF533 family)